MSQLLQDKRLLKVLVANILSSTGSGITMIAIPWLFINREGGEKLFGYVMLSMTVVLFLITPYIGLMVDRFSRKGILLFSQVVGFLLLLTFSILGFLGVHYQMLQLIILYASGSLYFSIFFPTMFAFSQEIFERSKYKLINGAMEVQSQTSSMLAGGIASILITRIHLSWILLIDAFSYAGAFIILAYIPYTKIKETLRNESFWNRLTEGYRYMRKSPLLFLFLFATFMPFIVLQVTNYIFPIYIYDTLHSTALVLGLSEFSYAVGAILAGIFIPYLMQRFGNQITAVMTILAFLLSILAFFFLPIVSIFLILQVLIGIGNAGTRVVRKTVMMEKIPNDKIGRVNSLYQVIGLAFRISLIGLFTKTLPQLGTNFSLGLLGLILVLALVGTIYSSVSLQRVPNHNKYSHQ